MFAALYHIHLHDVAVIGCAIIGTAGTGYHGNRLTSPVPSIHLPASVPPASKAPAVFESINPGYEHVAMMQLSEDAGWVPVVCINGLTSQCINEKPWLGIPADSDDANDGRMQSTKCSSRHDVKQLLVPAA